MADLGDMVETFSNDEGRRSPRTFRAVEPPTAETSTPETSTPETSTPETTGTEDVFPPADPYLEFVPSRLLVDGDLWCLGDFVGEGSVQGVIELPLVASIARVRSDADAAISLAGVIEGLARRFQFSVPFGLVDESTLRFVAPEHVDLDAVAKAVDEELLGQVRATDLDGGLRDRMSARLRVEREPVREIE